MVAIEELADPGLYARHRQRARCDSCVTVKSARAVVLFINRARRSQVPDDYATTIRPWSPSQTTECEALDR